jgi:hypothetical protein
MGVVPSAAVTVPQMTASPLTAVQLDSPLSAVPVPDGVVLDELPHAARAAARNEQSNVR